MIDITDKIKTLRVAKAQAIVKMSSETVSLIRNKEIPKGDIFEVSRAVAILSAKRVSEFLPFCHNIPIEWVGIEFNLKDEVF